MPGGRNQHLIDQEKLEREGLKDDLETRIAVAWDYSCAVNGRPGAMSMAETPFDDALGLLGIWKPMGVSLKGATETYDILPVCIDDRLIGYGLMGHRLMEPLESGDVAASDFTQRFRLEVGDHEVGGADEEKTAPTL